MPHRLLHRGQKRRVAILVVGIDDDIHVADRLTRQHRPKALQTFLHRLYDRPGVDKWGLSAPRVTAAAAIASAAGLSLDWLATGEGSSDSPDAPTKNADTPVAPPPAGQARLFNTLHIPKFAGAMHAVMNRFRDAGIEPDMEDAVRAAALLYDIMNDPNGPLKGKDHD